MDRRYFLRLGMAGLSLPALVSCGSDNSASQAGSTTSPNGTGTQTNEAIAALLDSQAPFPYGVASGDPTDSAVVLWTAVKPKDTNVEAIPLRLEYVLSTAELSDPAQWESAFTTGAVKTLGTFMALRARDYTVKVDLGNVDLYRGTAFETGAVEALPAHQFVYYRFVAGAKKTRIGRAKTLPRGQVESCKFAMVSCSNIAAGYFSVYEMVRREQLDFVVHLGDYFYENGGEGAGLSRNGVSRAPQPAKEVVELQDYVQRHQQYKAEPELQALHAAHPMIAVWDDHEITNDAYRDGAENHQPEEGDYEVRKAFAIRAYYNWMPLREQFERNASTLAPDPREVIYRNFKVGDLFDLIMLDTRIVGRDQQAATFGVDPARFDENRNLLGLPQRAWLSARLFESKQRGAIWTVLGQQVMFGQLNLVELPQIKLLGQSLLGNLVTLNLDQWDGYVAERNRVFNMVKDIGIENLVVLTGDIHTSWAIELYENPFVAVGDRLGKSLGVELVTSSVTSSGFPDEVADLVSQIVPVANPHIKYNELKTKGFTLVELRRDKMIATWKYAQNILDESLIGVENEGMRKTLEVLAGTNSFSEPSA